MLSFVQTALQKRVDDFHAHERIEFDFHRTSVASAHNDRLKRAIDNAVLRSDRGRSLKLLELPDSNQIRSLAGDIKQHTLDHLDYYLEQLATNIEKKGGHVHFASTGAEAKRIILDIVAKANCHNVIKSKSMVSEEIELAHVMEAAGINVIETDLGEFIVQIDHDKPSHIVTPIIHKDKESIGELFSSYFKTPYTNDPEALTKQARVFLRDKFRQADLGMTGGNFLVAETGDICCVENEGNVRQSMTTPRVLISLVGIEKVVPRMADLSVMLKLLARSATGQSMTVYSSIFGGIRKEGERDGPEEFHLVLMDNGRTEILASEEYRETLRCIRCGACLNACPIYRKIGGHSYGSVYPGPIGALITPLMQGLGDYKDLPNASSLCGACYEACPVKINIPKHLINLRRDIVSKTINTPIERIIYRVWAWTYKATWRYKLVSFSQKVTLRLQAGKKGWLKKLPFPGSGWTQVRDMPAPAAKTFREQWNAKKLEISRMNDPSNVLAKVRRSLGRTEPLTHAPVPPVLSEPLIRLVLSDIGLPQLFEKKATENKIGVTSLRVDDLAESLAEFLRKKDVKSVALPKSAFLERIGVPAALREAGFVVRVWNEMAVDDLYDVDAGVTDVWRVVAETGSLVMRASPEHGRGLSLVPPLHVAIVEPKNCVGDLIDLFELAKASGDASAFTIISGPSKTSDIEMNLVVGVHGPEKVQVFLLT